MLQTVVCLHTFSGESQKRALTEKKRNEKKINEDREKEMTGKKRAKTKKDKRTLVGRSISKKGVGDARRE